MVLTVTFCRVSLFSDVILRNKKFVKGLSTVPFSFKILEKCFSRKSETLLNSKRSLFTNRRLFMEQPNLPKKRVVKKKKIATNCEDFNITAFSTAEEYDLEDLLESLPKSTVYNPTAFGIEYGNLTDVVHAVYNSDSTSESQDLFFFREGSVVMWNVPDSERSKIFNFLKSYESNSFTEDVIEAESEIMSYSFSSNVNKTHIVKDALIFPIKEQIQLEKYAVSNAMALSVHLGTYEANLEKYIDAMRPVTEDLKAGATIKMSRDEVLQKTGQLFALRHNINLSSDLLDTPDFYWDRAELETLYQHTFNYFCINKRTRVINEKINHCIELVQLLSSHLNDKHHIRLEWMIIILIMVEVAFEVVHYVDRYLESKLEPQKMVLHQSS